MSTVLSKMPCRLPRPVLRKATMLATAILATIIGSCTYEPIRLPFLTPPPKVNAVSFYPQYFCSGDEIAVTWDTENIDRIELRNDAGGILLSTGAPSGTLTTPPVDASDLPLVIRGYARGDHEDHVVVDLVNIDNPEWTSPVPSTREYMDPNNRRAEFAYTETVTLDDGTQQSFPMYEVYVTYLGLRWDAGEEGTIPAFSFRAVIDRIRNFGGPTMHFQSYAAGSATIAEAAEGDIDPDWPGSINVFGGLYAAPNEVLFGWQHGDITKPPEPWFYIEQYYQEATGLVGLLA